MNIGKNFEGRLISEDTYKGQVDNPLSMNRYTYVHNNPLRFVDPTGHVAADGAGGYFGGSYEELMLHWSDVAVAYADANRIDFIDAVDIVVPVEHRAEVKTIVSFNGGAKAHYQAGDMPGLGMGATGAGAVAGIGAIKNTGKNVAATTKNLTEDVSWTNHGYKHFPSKNTTWSDVVKSTKSGPAKYIPGTDVEALERMVWEKGSPVTNGKTWKVMKFDKIIGASEGGNTQYIRVEYSGGTIHGHPITELEYKKLLK
ncbi:hypothetical protein P9361_19895 [Brevibacillus choshinensis]|nr:hypothetical protein [Brevibacillus choshinensis]